MIKVKRLDHVAIALPDIGDGRDRLRQLFGLGQGCEERVADQKTDVSFLETAEAGAAIELIAPSGNEGLERFLARRGPGLHHVCFQVDDLAKALRDLKAAGVPLVDEVPRPGARGHLVGFIHPKATGGVLFELCQHVQGDQRS